MDMPTQNLIAIYSANRSIEFSSQILQKLAHRILQVGGWVHAYEVMRAFVNCVQEAWKFSYYKEKSAAKS